MKFENEKIQKLYEEILERVEKGEDVSALQKEYLNSKDGKLGGLLRGIKDIAKDMRAIYGKEVNMLKTYVEDIANQQSDETKYSQSAKIDTSAPFDLNIPTDRRPKKLNKKGSQHPFTQELERILNIFQTMGFDILESRQLDNDYNMFDALNFPVGHPARDNYDSFWTEEGLIPPAHTSTMQNRALSAHEPPIRTVIPGRCYRNEATDASHEHTFFQIEGVYVDKDVSMANMLATIKAYLEAFFEKELDVKIQPAFFPFTEPDCEFLISCPFCNKAGCRVCGNTGWMEVMGCGMIHPNVFREAGIDHEVYSGFAWGFGLDRLVMIKNGIQDIRWINSGQLDFIEQF